MSQSPAELSSSSQSALQTPPRLPAGAVLGFGIAMLAVAAWSGWTGNVVPLAALTGAAAAVVIVWLGPLVAFPFYFATWFGTGLFMPGIPVSLNRVMAGVFVLSWLVWIAKGGKPRFTGAVMFGLLAVLTVWAVGTGLMWRAAGASPSIQQLAYLAASLALSSAIHSRADLARLTAVMVAIGCAINSVGLAEFIVGYDLFPQFSDHRMVAWDLRINGIAPNAIVFAFTCVWLLPWALWLHMQSHTRVGRWLALLAFAYLAMLSLMTFNRQTPLIVAAMVGVGLLLVRYPWRGALIVACAALAIAVAPFVVGRIADRLVQLGGDGAPDISLMIRRDKVLVALEVVRAHPWTGIGLDNFKDHWWEHRPRGELYQIHTDMARPQYIDLGWLQVLTETGIIGAALLLATLAAAMALWLAAWSRAHEPWVRNGLVAVLMLFIQLGLSMMVQDTFFNAWTYLAFGMLAVMVRFAREEG